ncbi:MAG: vgr related protein [Sphingomonas sp.]
MQSRGLTRGEIDLVRSIFGDALDVERVRLFHGKWWPFQPRRSAMAPMGDIWFHPDGGGWSEDFSKEPLSQQGYVIHEMTHVWQAQKGGRFYLPLMRHPFCRYDYALAPGKPFHRYGIEQQAEIVRHRFLADRGAAVPVLPPRELLPFG